MIKLSGVVITFNEEKNIEKCLASLVDVVDEIVVVDSFSTDRTQEICAAYNVKFIQQEFLGYIEQKKQCDDNRSGCWIESSRKRPGSTAWIQDQGKCEHLRLGEPKDQ